MVTVPAGAFVARASTSCEVSKSKPGTPSTLASTRSTFHAGRVSPKGRTTAWKLCKRPSALTKLPEVSVNGAIGSSTSLMSMLALNGLRVTTICAWPMAALAWAPLAASNAGSVLSNSTALRPPASIWPAFRPLPTGRAPANWAPTVLAASVR
ncbi:hypothetical protein D3C72_1828170 [compost metagenome]